MIRMSDTYRVKKCYVTLISSFVILSTTIQHIRRYRRYDSCLYYAIKWRFSLGIGILSKLFDV